MSPEADTRNSSRLAHGLSSPGGRLLCLGALVLVLLVPLAMIDQRVSERGQRRDLVASEVAGAWGSSQVVSGPILRVPYQRRWKELQGKQEIERSQSGWLYFAPRTLDARAVVETHTLRRSLFEVPVYRADLEMSGRFVLPDRSEWPIESDAEVELDRAELILGVSDPGAIEANSQVALGAHTAPLRPSALAFGPAGVHAIFREGLDSEVVQSGVDFRVALALKGASRLALSPVAGETLLRMTSQWPHPGFFGGSLPSHREVTDAGFEASWSVSELGRGYPGVWADSGPGLAEIEASAMGVNLVMPVDPYTMAARVSKYGALLLLLSFAAIWVMELLGGRPMHLIQYLLLGASLCLFGLLQLAIAEHLGFEVAFCIAAGLVVAQASGYIYLVQGSRTRAIALGGLLSSWFAYLYVVLRAEDTAFLLGATALFVALTGVMWSTRRVNWSARAQWDVATAQLDG